MYICVAFGVACVGVLTCCVELFVISVTGAVFRLVYVTVCVLGVC